MISSYIEILICCLLFWVTHLFCARKHLPEYKTPQLLLFYFFTRVFPLLMLAEKTQKHLLCLSMEWVIIGLLYYYVCLNKSHKMQNIILCYYFFQPASAMLILSGDIRGICVSLFVLFLLCVTDRIMEKRKISLYAFWQEYLLFCVGCSALILTGKNVYALCTIGVAVVGTVTRVVCLWKAPVNIGVCTPGAGGPCNTEEPGAANGSEILSHRKYCFSKIDFLCMALLTLVFAAAVLWKLGSHDTPETSATFKVGNPGENEIVLYFDEETDLSEVWIYLGYRGKRDISFSTMSKDSSAWEVLDGDYVAESAFCWNRVTVNRRLTSLGMVLLKEEAQIFEIVCLDGEGRVCIPQNSADYPALFDEQDLFVNPATYYDGTMFDEVYHGRTAYEFLHQLPIYENTHPPLGKSIISIGIALFGMNPFGFRIMCALAGILMIPLMYLFARKMFGKTDVACFATILLETAFMNTTLSRIATIDILVALFVLAMFFFMYGYTRALRRQDRFAKQMLWLFLSGLFMALAISTKWTGFYGAAGIAVIFFYSLLQQTGGIRGVRAHKTFLLKTACFCVLFFLVIPGIIYTLSYLPFARIYTDKSLIKNMLDNAKLMFTYHKDCVFDHPYSSEWYHWLVGMKPLADCRTYFDDGTAGAVMTMLNPLLCIGGLFALIHQFYLCKEKKCSRAFFLIVAYLSMLLPWLLIHRTVFIYQYFISALFLILMIANSLSYSRHRKRNMLVFAVLSMILYVLYYPVLTGRPAKLSFVNQILELFEGWHIA